MEDSWTFPWFSNPEDFHRSHSVISKTGYSLTRFFDYVRSDFICYLCGGLVRSPLECHWCGLLMCSPCWNRLQSVDSLGFGDVEQFLCPSCYLVSTPREPSKVLLRIIQSMRVYCKYRNQGCFQIHSLSDIKNHQRYCGYRTVSCANQEMCGATGRIMDMRRIPQVREETMEELYVCSRICEMTLEMEHLISEGRVELATQMFYQTVSL